VNVLEIVGPRDDEALRLCTLCFVLPRSALHDMGSHGLNLGTVDQR